MALQTSVFRDGAWVTETVSLQTILKAHAPGNHTRPAAVSGPRCGLLTKTVIESSKVNQILPVKLRSSLHNDVAFIGEHFVQIYQLRSNGRLKEVVRKTDFGCRIRNACVIGPSDSKNADDVHVDATPLIKPEFELPFLATQPQLPPQLLMVVLENGNVMFLFVRSNSDGKPEFVSERMASPRISTPSAGFHTALDPSFRYMALACPEDYFIVYELESREQLEQRYARGEPLMPVRSTRIRGAQGVIQNVAFLYPRPGDRHHIILLLIIVKNSKSKMVIYEWALGDDLSDVFAMPKQGHRIPYENRMPLLLIPLTVRSAFITVSADQISVCTECLHGPPNFETIDMALEPPTQYHHGLGTPLWTSWARPSRLESFLEKRDSVFLAREDGVVVYIEADNDSLVNRSTLVKRFATSISTFASMGDPHADVLILGSDSGPGSVWRAPARMAIEPLGILPNWSPAVDFTTTYFSGEKDKNNRSTALGKLQQPDRVFATCQHGKIGSITEYRYGKKASIGITLDIEAGTRDVWVIPNRDSSLDHDYHLFFSEPGCSKVFLLTADLAHVEYPTDESHLPYDLEGPTLVLADSDRLTVQITTSCVVVIRGKQSERYYYNNFEFLSGATVMNADVFEECVAISAHTSGVFKIFIFKIDLPRLGFTHVRTINASGEVTCISITQDFTLLIGLWKGSEALMGRCSLAQQNSNEIETESLQKLLKAWHGRNGHSGSLGIEHGGADDADTFDIESVGSIVSVQGTIFVGTRSGELITLEEAGDSFTLLASEKLGTTPATLTCSYLNNRKDPVIFVICDNTLVSVEASYHGRLESRSRVWPVDHDYLGSLPKPVHHARAVDLPSEDGEPQLLIISEGELLFAELDNAPGPVQRSIPLGAVPTKVMYSQFLQCLVVAVHKDNRPSLLFIQPNTGEDISKPVDAKEEPVEFISGLGKTGDRIMCLNEWKFIKGGKTFYYLVAGTKNGHLVVISSSKEARGGGKPPVIRYWMRWKKDYERPVYSVLGFDEGLVFCTGETLRWELVDEAEKRLKTLKSFELESPATSLKISNARLMVMTSKDSLMVLDHIRETDKELTNLYNTDPRRRRGGHFIDLPGFQADNSDSSHGSIVLVSDTECQVGGLWVPLEVTDNECPRLFNATLFASVRKFHAAKTRPLWDYDGRARKFGSMLGSPDNVIDVYSNTEILGISLNGSLHHFTLLSIDAWRFLRFIQNLALISEDRASAQIRDPEPRFGRGLEMQVDGDLLERFLRMGALESLLSKSQHMSRCMELLEEINDGRHTAGFSAEEDGERYLKLAYDILRYYLRPAL